MSKLSKPAVMYKLIGNVIIHKPCRTLLKFEFPFMQIRFMFQNTIFYGSNRPRGLNLVGHAIAVTVVPNDASM